MELECTTSDWPYSLSSLILLSICLFLFSLYVARYTQGGCHVFCYHSTSSTLSEYIAVQGRSMRLIVWMYAIAYTIAYIPFLRQLNYQGDEQSLFSFIIFTIGAVYCIPIFPVHGSERQRRAATLLVDRCVPMRLTEQLHNAVAFTWMVGSLVCFHSSKRFSENNISTLLLWIATAAFIAFGIVQGVYRPLRYKARHHRHHHNDTININNKNNSNEPSSTNYIAIQKHLHDSLYHQSNGKAIDQSSSTINALPSDHSHIPSAVPTINNTSLPHINTFDCAHHHHHLSIVIPDAGLTIPTSPPSVKGIVGDHQQTHSNSSLSTPLLSDTTPSPSPPSLIDDCAKIARNTNDNNLNNIHCKDDYPVEFSAGADHHRYGGGGAELGFGEDCGTFGVFRVISLLLEFTFAYLLALLPTVALCVHTK